MTAVAPYVYSEPVEAGAKLPYREYEQFPGMGALNRLWFVEQLVELWLEHNDRGAFDVLAAYRRDLAPGDLRFMLDELVELSGAVGHERDDNSDAEPFGALRQDYLLVLDRVATIPGGAS